MVKRPRNKQLLAAPRGEQGHLHKAQIVMREGRNQIKKFHHSCVGLIDSIVELSLFVVKQLNIQRAYECAEAHNERRQEHPRERRMKDRNGRFHHGSGSLLWFLLSIHRKNPSSRIVAAIILTASFPGSTVVPIIGLTPDESQLVQ